MNAPARGLHLDGLVGIALIGFAGSFMRREEKLGKTAKVKQEIVGLESEHAGSAS